MIGMARTSTSAASTTERARAQREEQAQRARAQLVQKVPQSMLKSHTTNGNQEQSGEKLPRDQSLRALPSLRRSIRGETLLLVGTTRVEPHWRSRK